MSRQKTLILILLLLAEIGFAVYINRSTKKIVAQAYVVKNGPSYILLWKSADNDTVAKHYSYLHEALQFANDELYLEVGHNPNSSSMVEAVWKRDDVGKRMVFWTTTKSNFPNRLSFHRSYEAEVFLGAFKRGAYTTSPFGHSLSLVPKLSTP